MKLAEQQLESHLKKNLAPLYIISSDEFLLVQETITLIREAAYRAGFLERQLITVENNSEWEKTLFTATQSLSLFSEKTLIELNFQQAKFTAQQGKILQTYADHPARDSIVLIRTNKVDSKTEKSAWFQSLEKKSIFLSLWPINATQLPQWILQRAKKLNLTINKQTADKITEQSEGNLLAAYQALEKLALLSLSDTKEVSHSEEDNARFDVFDLVDSFLNSNAARSLRILKNLQAEDVEPTFILWALAREFRMLAEMSQQLKQGVSFSNLFQQFRIYEKRQSPLRTFLQKTSLTQCFDLLLYSAKIDRIIKGAEAGDVWLALERLVFAPQSVI